MVEGNEGIWLVRVPQMVLYEEIRFGLFSSRVKRSDSSSESGAAQCLLQMWRDVTLQLLVNPGELLMAAAASVLVWEAPPL